MKVPSKLQMNFLQVRYGKLLLMTILDWNAVLDYLQIVFEEDCYAIGSCVRRVDVTRQLPPHVTDSKRSFLHSCVVANAQVEVPGKEERFIFTHEGYLWVHRARVGPIGGHGG